MSDHLNSLGFCLSSLWNWDFKVCLTRLHKRAENRKGNHTGAHGDRRASNIVLSLEKQTFPKYFFPICPQIVILIILNIISPKHFLVDFIFFFYFLFFFPFLEDVGGKELRIPGDDPHAVSSAAGRMHVPGPLWAVASLTPSSPGLP